MLLFHGAVPLGIIVSLEGFMPQFRLDWIGLARNLSFPSNCFGVRLLVYTVMGTASFGEYSHYEVANSDA